MSACHDAYLHTRAVAIREGETIHESRQENTSTLMLSIFLWKENETNSAKNFD